MSYNLSGVHVVNKFIWKTAQAEGIMDASNYGGLVPIIPTQQVPSFNDLPTAIPYIVYNSVTSGYDEEFWADLENINYTVYCNDGKQLRILKNWMVDLFKRWDWTAGEINDFIHGVSFNASSEERQFDFKYTNVTGAVGPEPSTQENGRQAVMVSIRVAYTYEIFGDITPENAGRMGRRS